MREQIIYTRPFFPPPQKMAWERHAIPRRLRAARHLIKWRANIAPRATEGGARIIRMHALKLFRALPEICNCGRGAQSVKVNLTTSGYPILPHNVVSGVAMCFNVASYYQPSARMLSEVSLSVCLCVCLCFLSM